MSDLIRITQIRAWGRHGVSAKERENLQLLEIDIQLDVDLHLAGASDALADTVDYSYLHKRVVSIVETTSFKLLEALSERIIVVLFEDKRIRSARLRVAKPEKLNGATPSISIERSNL